MNSGANGQDDILFDFPCDFPLKIMGKNDDNLAQTVLEIILRHAPDFDASGMELRASARGRYVGLTCTIRATSRAQLDALYRELTGHPLIKIIF